MVPQFKYFSIQKFSTLRQRPIGSLDCRNRFLFRLKAETIR